MAKSKKKLTVLHRAALAHLAAQIEAQSARIDAARQTFIAEQDELNRLQAEHEIARVALLQMEADIENYR